MVLRIRERVRKLETERPIRSAEPSRFTPAELKRLNADPILRALGERSQPLWDAARERYNRIDGAIQPRAGEAYRTAVYRAATDDELRALQELAVAMEARIALVLGRPTGEGRR